MASRGRPTIQAHDERIVALAAEGHGYMQIAAAVSLSYKTLRRAVNRLGISVQDGRGAQKGCFDRRRATAMAERYKSGETLQQIADDYGISRERVRQILRQRTDVTAEQGGAKLRFAHVRTARASKRDLAYMEKLGCGWDEYVEIRALGREIVAKGGTYHRSPMGAFVRQRINARNRNIDWHLSFWDWWHIWQSSGRWSQRGRGQGYVMCRRNDEGPYSKDNVFIATAIENISSAKHKKKDLPTGVTFTKGAFVAQRGHKGKIKYLGRFKTAALAYAAYVAAAPGLHPSAPPVSSASANPGNGVAA